MTDWIPPDREARSAAVIDRHREDAVLRLGPPEEIVKALAPVLGPARAGRMDAVAAARLGGVVVVLENLHDPHNGGAALRSCEATGLLEVRIIEGAEPFRVSSKVTQGCDKWLDLHRHRGPGGLESCVAELRRRGFRLYAAVPGAGVPLEDLDPLCPAAFVVGNEHAGLTPAARAACDVEFALPLHGFSQSLNLSVATALCVYVHASRRRAALGTPGDLPPERLAELRARYYARDIRGAAEIVRRHVADAA